MTVTLKRLAEELNISPATVSLALGNSPMVAKATRDCVLKLAEQYDYVPSNLGRALQSRTSHLIGVYLPRVTASFFNEILQGAGMAAIREKYNLLLGWTSSDNESCNAQIRLLLEKDIDALVIADVDGNIEKHISRFLRRNKPVVFCNHDPYPGSSAVLTDDILGGRLAIRVLADAGHHKVLSSTRWKNRIAGNYAEAEARGVEIVEYDDWRKAVAFCRVDRSITGITAYSDEEAIDIMYELRQAGLRVPEDVSLVGFDGLAIGERPEFRLTTIAQQRTRLGEIAVEIALNQFRTSVINPVVEKLAPSPVLRATVASPREYSRT